MRGMSFQRDGMGLCRIPSGERVRAYPDILPHST